MENILGLDILDLPTKVFPQADLAFRHMGM